MVLSDAALYYSFPTYHVMSISCVIKRLSPAWFLTDDRLAQHVLCPI